MVVYIGVGISVCIVDVKWLKGGFWVLSRLFEGGWGCSELFESDWGRVGVDGD